MAIHTAYLQEIDNKIWLRGLRWGFSSHNRSPYREQEIDGKVIRHSRQNELPKAQVLK